MNKFIGWVENFSLLQVFTFTFCVTIPLFFLAFGLLVWLLTNFPVIVILALIILWVEGLRRLYISWVKYEKQ